MNEQDLDTEVNTSESESPKQDFFSMSDEELANVSFTSEEVVKEEPETTQSEEEGDTVVEDTENEVSDEKTEQTTNWEEQYKAALAPLKASGKLINIDNIDELRTLAQMGIDYQKKMVALKPHKSVIKTLEKEGIDAERLNYLIDLNKKNPDAIKQLLKDSGINPLEIDTEEELKYTPTNYKVDESTVAMDDVIESISTSPKFTSTVEIVSKQWDNKSREVIANNPEYLVSLNEHVHNGVYDQIDAVLQKEKLLGRLKGMSDIDAYIQIGNYMQENGLFKNQPTKPTTEITQPIVQTKQEDVNKQKKLAASPTKTVAKSKSPINAKDIDWLNLPDDEFAKLEKQFKLR